MQDVHLLVAGVVQHRVQVVQEHLGPGGEAGLLILALGLAELTLVSLDGLEGLVIGLVGMVQGNFKLIDVRLELLLDPETLSLGALLGLEGGLERLHGTAVVLTANIMLKNSSVPASCLLTGCC